MPSQNIRRSSNMLYMYKIDVGCSLKYGLQPQRRLNGIVLKHL